MTNKYKKITYSILTIIIIIIAMLIFKKNNVNNENVIDCNADLVIDRGDNILNIAFSQTLSNGKGVWSISGTISKGDNKDFIGQTIEFNYTKENDIYKLQSTSIQNSPQMIIPSDRLEKIITKFMLYPEQKLTIRIENISFGKWIVYSRTTPMFVCEK
ncbi:hypothetical protein [Klebsiella grimontii]|uniref:hypothetical protein n=1 Tax=Klebsiella grimontii TaxID=2058152 RepID=UPI0010481B34|nr:hypothetical protein [Klebsiella grimontii]TCZ55666.1 hypothetical protein E0D83_26470 [Klebsiella grimontii]